jgi:hypothetical protein
LGCGTATCFATASKTHNKVQRFVKGAEVLMIAIIRPELKAFSATSETRPGWVYTDFSIAKYKPL